MPVPPNLPTSHQDGVNELIPAGIVNDLARAVNTLPAFYNVMTYGAKGDGTTDDTVAIQAAIDAALNSAQKSGTVIFPTPALYYKVTSTIKVYRSDFAMAHVNLIGMQGGNNGITISWQGPNDSAAGGVAMQIIENWDFEVRNLNITNGGARGTSVGLLVTRQNAGTGCSGGLFTNVIAVNFDHGIQIGGGPPDNGSASELTFINSGATSCNTGVYTQQLNTLDLYWINLQISSNGIGADFHVANSFVIGGSASSNGLDFQASNGGTFAVSYFRSENNPGQFANVSSANTVLLGNLVSSAPASGPSIVAVANLTMIGNNINGYVQINDPRQAVAPDVTMVTMIGNTVLPGITGQTTGLPFDSNSCCIYDCRSNNSFGYPNWLFDDMIGSMDLTTVSHLQRLSRSFKAPLFSHSIGSVQGISGTQVAARNLSGSVVLSGGSGSVVFGQAEQQQIALTGSPTGGLFALAGLGGCAGATPNPNWNATAAEVAAHVAGFRNVGTGNVTGSGGPLPGTPVVLTFAGVLATGPQYLASLAIAGNALTGGTSPNVVVTRTVLGTFAEPDANYRIQLTGNVNETFWVTGKATNGFTIHSSNGTSTASVDWMLVR